MSTIFGAERKLSPELLTPDDICASASASSAIAGKSATETNETISNGTGWGDNRELNSVANRKVSHSRWMNQKTALIEKVAERETLVKLMGFIDAMVERKAALLSTIEKCHGCFEINLRRRTNQGLSSSIVNCDTATVCFHRHYAWLLANLELNDQCLDSALTFLVSMYGGAYAGPSKSFAHGDREKVIEIETLVHYLDNFGKGFSEQLWEDWAKAMRKGVEAIGEELFLAIPSLKERKKEGESDMSNSRKAFLDSRLSSVSSLLQTVRLCTNSVVSTRNNIDTKTNTDPFTTCRAGRRAMPEAYNSSDSIGPITCAIQHVLFDSLEKIQPPPLLSRFSASSDLEQHSSKEGPASDLEQLDSKRDAGYQYLNEAVALLYAEVAAMSAEASKI